jgi:hypothetical protein
MARILWNDSMWSNRHRERQTGTAGNCNVRTVLVLFVACKLHNEDWRLPAPAVIIVFGG